MCYQLTEAKNLILLTTEHITLGIERETGALAHLSWPGENSVTARATGVAPLAIRLDGQWLSGPGRRLDHTLDETAEGVALTATVALGPVVVTERFHLVGPLVERSIEVVLADEGLGDGPPPLSRQAAHTVKAEGNEGGQQQHATTSPILQLFGVRLAVPGVAIGSPEDCCFEAPASAVRPRLPLSVAARQSLEQPGADADFAPGARSRWFTAINDCPDVTPGLMVVHNATLGRGLLVWYVSRVEAASALVTGDGRRADLVHDLALATWLAPGQVARGGTQYIVLHQGDYASALDAYRSYYTRTGIEPPLYGHPPDWVPCAAIYEVHPGQFGGFQGLAAQIPRLAMMGIDVLYLMPVMAFDNRNGQPWDENWLGGGSPYAMKDFEQLEPTLGTEADFRHLVDTAHAQGIRVLMDFVPQGCALDARYVDEHPEWFCRDEAGAWCHSHDWIDTWSFDWANPDYQQYMLDWSLRLMREWDLDGYRVDAPHGKEPNWDRSLACHASATNLGVIGLLERLQRGLKAIKPDSVLLCELFGPIFSHSHDLLYDYYPMIMAYELLDQRLTPWEFGEWLSDYWQVEPPGAARVAFTETHDTRGFHPPSYALRGSAGERALFGILAMSGFVPMIWSGQERGWEPFYADVFRARRSSAALRHGQFLFNAVSCREAVTERDYEAHTWVFGLLRRSGGEAVWGLVSLWPEKTPFQFSLPLDKLGLDPAEQYRLHDLISGRDWDEYGRTSWSGAQLAQIVLTPEPFRPYCLAIQT